MDTTNKHAIYIDDFWPRDDVLRYAIETCQNAQNICWMAWALRQRSRWVRHEAAWIRREAQALRMRQ